MEVAAHPTSQPTSQPAIDPTIDPMFRSAHQALVFAFRYSAQLYERPLMNRLAAPAVGSDKGLSGLDGSAQAGIIRAEVAALGRVAEAVLLARVAPRAEQCSCRAPCCSGHKPNREWTNAIGVLVDQVSATALAGCVANGLLRRDYVVRYFSPQGQRENLDALADRRCIHRQTASAHNSRVVKWLKERETAAGSAIEKRLVEIGLVGGEP